MDINYKNQDRFDHTPFLLLCSNKGSQCNGVLLKCFKILLERKDFDVNYALDLLCENCNRGLNLIGEQSDEHQLLLLPIIKLLVEQPKGGLELVQTGSPLYFYRLLQHYKGKDLVDIVKYFVIDKKMPFDKETAIYFLQHRNDLPNREEIEIILQNVVQ